MAETTAPATIRRLLATITVAGSDDPAHPLSVIAAIPVPGRPDDAVVETRVVDHDDAAEVAWHVARQAAQSRWDAGVHG